jgi:hypothetical protein
MTLDLPVPGPAAATARRLREAEYARLMAEKTRPAREAQAEERRRRAEQHRVAALQPLSERLAGIVFDEIERSGRVLVAPSSLTRSTPRSCVPVSPATRVFRQPSNCQ